VLCLHMSSPPRRVKPAYSSPDRRGSAAKAVGIELAVLLHVKGRLTAPTACGLQVGHGLTQTLIERAICLDKAYQLLKVR
jgi:hypothetical protein